MRLLPRSWKGWSITIGAVLGAVVLWFLSAYPRGALTAQIDQAFGHYEVQFFGPPPPPWWPDYRKMLKDKYDVELRGVAGCLVTPQLVWYVSGYNSVSERRIEEKYGKDIFKECFTLTRKSWAAAHPKEFKKWFGEDP
jgi:hypothetical protein